MFEETDEQIEFHNKLEVWCGPIDRKPEALNWIEGVRIQGKHVCLELIDDDGDETEWAISLSELVKKHGEFIKYSHPEDSAESKAEILKALRDAIEAIEQQNSDPETFGIATANAELWGRRSAASSGPTRTTGSTPEATDGK